MRLIKKYTLLNIINNYLVDSPVPSNISYLWNFGSLLGVSLAIQIISGVSLSFHYVSDINLAFISIENIMRNENYGWLLRYLHANGAGLFFIIVYLHIGRNLYYGSYNKPRILLWNMGVLILLAMMATAFLGYVIVWGSMSFWGAIVITNFFSAIPWIGTELVQFIWGAYSVDNPTLNRFYGLHFLLPFIISFMVILHLIGLHDNGSNNPIGNNSRSDKITFHMYFTYKDLITFIILFITYFILIGFIPNYLGHPDNYIQANPLITPASIVPEFYFLPYYAILRAIPNKLLGVIAMFLSICLLFILPWIQIVDIRSNMVKFYTKILYWVFIGNFIMLLLLGGLPVEYPFVIIGQFACFLYFMSLLILPLLIGILEYYLYVI